MDTFVPYKILEDPDLLLNTVPGKPKASVNLSKSGGKVGAERIDLDDGGSCC